VRSGCLRKGAGMAFESKFWFQSRKVCLLRSGRRRFF